MYVLPPTKDILPDSHYAPPTTPPSSACRSPPTTPGVHSSPTSNRRDSVAVAAEPISSTDDSAEDAHSFVSDGSDLDERRNYLHALLKENGIPVSHESIDLAQLGKGVPLQTRVLAILTELLPHFWSHVTNPEQIQLERVSGAMTNCIFFVSGPPAQDGAKPPKILLRVYGSAADTFIKRDREMFWLCKMGHVGVAPRLLGAFANGRFEQFLDSTTLTKEDLRDPSTSRQIAQAMYKLHKLIQNCDAHEASSPDLWTKLRKWHRLASKAVTEFKRNQPERYAKLRKVVNIKTVAAEIDELEAKLSNIGSPIVFAHNDAQYGNILRKNKDGSIIVVDYEYSSVNYRGYDFGNHFCEWAADYHSPNPHLMHFEKYPTQSEQLSFFSAYLDAQIEAGDVPPPSPSTRASLLDQMYKETNKFALCSHLLWGLWGIMQAGETNIDFDFVGYGLQRFGQYYRVKEKYLAL
ncbi:uncharacterized protein SPPG_09071 [Spizellomyces punctatus DAOM BR117]|uniref:Choline/ethanolamine kinase n=1 Tax=Spizellomyces punctatus (strain DAOM BR117) TaxID=645134 RepID=A0A0L0HNS2_SPIPD|nr:uncharacterized protein SPPG_09071 [Spizellomyces punctatus DAOM BR117]KND02474.1 hypothetical protein SPPG_09071 [Spizellomyces punctatus DAOM BR117]|eukprot:XP_016610513.1 hypothetical protein SPPG_09071 [Spizellomyces punctatus DAOM BR117]